MLKGNHVTFQNLNASNFSFDNINKIDIRNMAEVLRIDCVLEDYMETKKNIQLLLPV